MQLLLTTIPSLQVYLPWCSLCTHFCLLGVFCPVCVDIVRVVPHQVQPGSVPEVFQTTCIPECNFDLSSANMLADLLVLDQNQLAEPPLSSPFRTTCWWWLQQSLAPRSTPRQPPRPAGWWRHLRRRSWGALPRGALPSPSNASECKGVT